MAIVVLAVDDRVVNDFWTGAASALIGAIVGGIASWLAAWMQVKAAMRVARVQADDAIKAQRLLRKEQLEHDAIRAFYPMAIRQMSALADIDRAHLHFPAQDGRCPEEISPPPTVAEVVSEYERLYPLHYAFLHEAVRDDLSWVAETLESMSRGQLNFVPMIAGPPHPDVCVVYRADIGASELSDYVLRCFRHHLMGKPLPEPDHRNRQDEEIVIDWALRRELLEQQRRQAEP